MTQKELTDRLDLASRQYYNGLTSEFSDTEFDLKLKELQKMEAESGIVLPNSPTIRVGSDIQDGFEKGEHPRPMFIIENVYNDEELLTYITEAFKFSNEHPVLIDQYLELSAKGIDTSSLNAMNLFPYSTIFKKRVLIFKFKLKFIGTSK